MSQPPPLNPYAAPAGEIVIPAAAQMAWIEKKSLVVPKGWVSPPICLHTGATTDLMPIRRKKLAWSNPVMFVLILIGIIGIVILLALQKKGVIHYYLSRSAAAKMRKKLLINWGLFGVGVCLFASSFAFPGDPGYLILAGMITALISAFAGVLFCRTLKPGKIDQTQIWLNGIPGEVREAIVAMEFQKLAPPWR